jgi:hypothetical protein
VLADHRSARELHPFLLQLGRWGARSPIRPESALSIDALMLALESTFNARNAAQLRATLELRLGDERFSVAIDRGTIAIARGAPPTPDAIIDTVILKTASMPSAFGVRRCQCLCIGADAGAAPSDQWSTTTMKVVSGSGAP